MKNHCMSNVSSHCIPKISILKEALEFENSDISLKMKI